MDELGKVGANYLSEAIELALKTEPEHLRITKTQLFQNRAISPAVDKRNTRMLELAFRAGRVSERHSTYYRGIPNAAQDGMPMVESKGTSAPRKEWTAHVQVLLAKEPTIKTQAIAES